MRLEDHEAKMHLSNAEVIVVRELYAKDQCTCGHQRVTHYSPGGSTGRCLTPGCRCTGYGWDKTEPPR